MALAAGGTALTALAASPLGKAALAATGSSKIKAVAFDAFPIFDPRAAFRVVKEKFPEQGDDLRKAWFAKIFGYTWLRTSGRRYKDFWHVMEDALRFSAAGMKLDLTPEKQDAIMDAFLRLPLWPDVQTALEKLHGKNIRLAFLSNMTESMLRANMKHNDIEKYFEFALSTDRAQAFKPAPAAYRLGVEAFGLRKEEIAFTAFAGWDSAGAKWFGYPTVWVNRLGFPEENLDAPPSATGRDLTALIDFIHA
ncbi:MAG: haloacid dehalogenase type II [Alphaproteobacteria bacterium]|nr:haloacid dehalogenase type II [Alphaproteobacteria bacterium]